MSFRIDRYFQSIFGVISLFVIVCETGDNRSLKINFQTRLLWLLCRKVMASAKGNLAQEGMVITMKKENIVFIIPALNPDEKLLHAVQELKREGFDRFLVVNDGSCPDSLRFFEQAEALGCVVFHHYKNMGKGRALKNAFNQVYYQFPDFEAVVTLDADGQHLTKDVISVAKKAVENPECLILGSRSFGKDVPLRSKFGNNLTKHVMRLFCNLKISDTQTGLRGFSRHILSAFLTSKGERYEYETNMLLDTKELDIRIIEVPITTVYIDENSSSHFNPVKDSLRIYSQFLKYILASLASLVIDISLFTVFVQLLKGTGYNEYRIYISTVAARAISSFVNFLINRNTVFKSKGAARTQTAKQIVLYYLLVVINVVASSLAVNYIVKILLWNETLVKVCVDTVLFFLNYIVQRELIFRKRKSK